MGAINYYNEGEVSFAIMSTDKSTGDNYRYNDQTTLHRTNITAIVLPISVSFHSRGE